MFVKSMRAWIRFKCNFTTLLYIEFVVVVFFLGFDFSIGCKQNENNAIVDDRQIYNDDDDNNNNTL